MSNALAIAGASFTLGWICCYIATITHHHPKGR